MTEKTTADLFGDGPARNTREKILHASLDLFMSEGVHAIGIDRIVGDVGVTKTTFYNHFPSKDDLVVEALELRDNWEFDTLMEELQKRAGFNPRKMLLAIFDVYDDWFNHEDFRGCLFINTCAEFPNPRDRVHKAAARHQERVKEQIRQLAEGAGLSDPQAIAEEWTLLLMGAVTTRLVLGADYSAENARRVALKRLEEEVA